MLRPSHSCYVLLCIDFALQDVDISLRFRVFVYPSCASSCVASLRLFPVAAHSDSCYDLLFIDSCPLRRRDLLTVSRPCLGLLCIFMCRCQNTRQYKGPSRRESRGGEALLKQKRWACIPIPRNTRNQLQQPTACSLPHEDRVLGAVSTLKRITACACSRPEPQQSREPGAAP